ncbi:MAG: hypothetical protein U0354_17260 [Candidatus Sericytochromatia bacterium]
MIKIFSIIIISLTLINSCAYIQDKNKNIPYEDILDFESNDVDEIKEQISIREKRVLELTTNVDTLNSYTKKISQRSDLDYLYGRDNSTIEKYLQDTKKNINKYNLIKTRTLKEIRILERRLESLKR